MKLLFCVLMIVATIGAGAAEAEIPHVTVFGTAVTQAKPDMLRWHVTVSNKGAELAVISEQHTSSVNAVLRLLNQKRLRPEEIQTTDMRFSENREYRGSSWIKDGYIATTEIWFTMRNLADYRQTWIDLARLGGISVDSVSWDLSTRIEAQNSTRTEALQSAKAKAEQMAAALGVKIAEPIAIEEIQNENPWQNPMANRVTAEFKEDESGETIAPGSVNIRVRVRVVYQLASR